MTPFYVVCGFAKQRLYLSVFIAFSSSRNLFNIEPKRLTFWLGICSMTHNNKVNFKEDRKENIFVAEFGVF